MTTTLEPKDQTKRKHSIALLEATIAKAEATMRVTQTQLDAMRDRQVNRLAELRCQKLMLHFAVRAAAMQAAEVAT